MRKMKIRTLLALALMLASFAVMAKIPDRPYPQRLVNDLAGVFTASQQAALEQRLVAFDDTTSNQIAVVTLSDLEGQDPAMVAYEIGEKWGVGREKSNNGIVILIKPKTGSQSGNVFISVGYGLEGAIPDAITKRIVDNEMIPHLRNGNDYYSAVNAALDVLMPLACGEISERDYDDGGDLFLFGFVFFLIAVAFLVIIAASANGGSTNIGSGNKGHKLDLWDIIVLSNLFGSGSSSGSGSWGGSNSGWGGSRGGGFGGGGFGGFGGGHFGGGGAGGSW